ncbi:MAG: sugar ABC transporter permease [Nakamurella sp.]
MPAKLATPKLATDAAGLGRARAGALVAPALILVAIFLIFPALWTIYLGLTDYSLTGSAAADPQFVGTQNFVDAFNDRWFLNSLWVTLIYVAGSAIIGQTVLGFGLAWMLRNARPAVRGIVETLVLFAWLLPSSVISFLWIAMLDRRNGTLNVLLDSAGFNWLIQYPLLLIIVFNIWRGTAFSMMLFSAALQSVPPSQLESAKMAGANGAQQFRDVVFPHIRGHILTNTLLISLWTFNDFGPYLLTAGGPNHRTEILPVFIYNEALKGGQLGYGAAISLIMLVINLIIALVYLSLLRKKRVT